MKIVQKQKEQLVKLKEKAQNTLKQNQLQAESGKEQILKDLEYKLKEAEDEVNKMKEEQLKIQDSDALQNDVLDTRILKISQEKDIVSEKLV